jgi:hypothetical protein
VTIGDYLEARILDAVFNNTSLAITATYVKLHIGDPGEAGTANPAANTTRQAASWAPASGGTIATDAALTWASVPAAETYTHVSVWDASTAGNHLWNGPLTVPYYVNVGDTFTIPSGVLTATLD